MESYLIQRAKSYDQIGYPADESKKGIDKIVSWDYMGSSEFEFGALKETLKRIRKDISQYEIFTFRQTANNHAVYFFCKKDKREEVIELLNKLGDFTQNYRLKEYIKFSKWFDPRINIPAKNDLKKIKVITQRTVYSDNNANWYIKRNTKFGDVWYWHETEFLENFWFDITNDFMFFVDVDGNLNNSFVRVIS